MTKQPFYYLFCNHWTQSGIGFAFPSGWYNGKKYDKTFSSAYTIHKMLDAADDYPGLKASMELDAYTYEEVLKEDPQCIERLKEYIRLGKAGVDGGTYGQPFGQDYGWEPNIRHLTVGRETVARILDYDVKAFLVEEQWFHPQLPQLLLQSGFKYASLQNQNSGQVKPMNESMIRWVGIDGSKVPTIPANDLQVSCVRQYTDYSVYAQRLQEYNVPLLFQWVEIWPPGMDWGASATPFEKAIHQVFEWDGRSVTLGDYFELEAGKRELKDVYIPLDESNYANNWYQGGGWGYDGDKVISYDKKSERSLITFETMASINALKQSVKYPGTLLNDYWKKLMLLQNHDFSVARSYRAFTEDGLVTEAGALGVMEYERLTRLCNGQIEELMTAWDEQSAMASGEEIVIFNTAEFPHRKTIELELPTAGQDSASISLYQGDVPIPFQITEVTGEQVRGLAVVDLPAMGTASIQVGTAKGGESKAVRSGETWIEDENCRIEWVPNTWAVAITDKPSGKLVEYSGFSGPIGKLNEHDADKFHALSPGHEVFTFAFDGTTHAPDQNARVTASVETVGSVRSTLLLRCDLLTLHTTPTPVAFAEVRVSLNHETGSVVCQSHFYTGVYLNLQCWASFKHNLPNARYYRDFPFGEEETQVEYNYPNTYTRVASQADGFTLVHSGTQRSRVIRGTEDGEVKHLLARDRVFGDYTWTFALHFGAHQPWESARLAKAEHGYTPVVRNAACSIPSFVQLSDPRVMVSALYEEGDGRTMLRLVNYATEAATGVEVEIDHPFGSAHATDFNGSITGSIELRPMDRKCVARVDLKPWEIVTIALS